MRVIYREVREVKVLFSYFVAQAAVLQRLQFEAETLTTSIFELGAFILEYCSRSACDGR